MQFPQILFLVVSGTSSGFLLISTYTCRGYPVHWVALVVSLFWLAPTICYGLLVHKEEQRIGIADMAGKTEPLRKQPIRFEHVMTIVGPFFFMVPPAAAGSWLEESLLQKIAIYVVCLGLGSWMHLLRLMDYFNDLTELMNQPALKQTDA